LNGLQVATPEARKEEKRRRTKQRRKRKYNELRGAAGTLGG
jgi:hypothetical protein